MKSFIVLGIIPLLLFSGDYFGGDGVVEITRGEWISGDKINLNQNDSLYFTISNIGGIKTPQVFGAVPKPMNGNSQSTWAVIFTNPTSNAITINQVDIIQPNLHFIFNSVSGINPVSGWVLPSQSNVRWSGSIVVPPNSAFDFICNITGTGAPYINDSIRLRITTNAGIFENNTFSTSSGNLLPSTNIAFIKNGITFYFGGLYSNENHQYLLKLYESSNNAPIDSGTNLLVTIPPSFKNVMTGINPDFLNPSIMYDSVTGWSVSTSLLRPLQNDSALFNFSAVSPIIGGKSLYSIGVNFGQSRAQGVVQVLPPPAIGDSGQIQNTSLYIICPDPMDRNTYGVWGGVLVNPTENPIHVTQFNIQSQPGSNLFNNVIGEKPATGWSRVNFNTIRWTGNIMLYPHGALTFICRIKGNNRNASNIPVTFTCETSQGNYTRTDSTNQLRTGIPYANLYYLVGGSASGLIAGIQSGGLTNFVVRVAETSRRTIPSGTTLRINIPPKWSSVTASVNQPGFGPATIIGDSINGWTITTSTNVNISNSYRDFQFSARAPSVAIDAYYSFPTFLINNSTTPNINSICEAVVGVQNPSTGIIVDHISPSFLEPSYSISAIDINLVSRASIPELGFLSIYNFNLSQWENLSQGTIDTNETFISNSITSNVNNYLSATNKIIVRSATIHSNIHSISEDFLFYRTSSFYVVGIDRAPSLVNRGQDSVVMMRLDFISGLGTYGIDTIRIYLSGTGTVTDVSGVRLFDDLNRNGFLDPGELQVGTTQVFNANGIATFAGSPLFTFSDASPKSILLVYTISNLAVIGNYVGVDILNSNDILTSNHLPVPGIYPISSTQARITQDAPVIHWAYASPESIAPNMIEMTRVFAKVSDPQGLGDIQWVRVDCQEIGGDSSLLMYDDGTHGDSIAQDSIYTRDSIQVAIGTLPGNYYLPVTAMDLADTTTRTLVYLFVKDIQPPQFNTQPLNDTSFIGPHIVKSGIIDFSGIFTDSLYHRRNSGPYNAVTHDSISGGIYYFQIPAGVANDTFYYYLSAIDNRGNRGTDPVNAPDSVYRFVILPGPGINEYSVQSRYLDFRVYPIPAKGNVNIVFNIRDVNEKNLSLKIYDVTGRLVKYLPLPPNYVKWTGTDDFGRKLPGGIYFIVLSIKDNNTGNEQRNVRKIIFIR